MKRIYFVRHGETTGNLAKEFQTFDTELTEAGHEGARKVAERLKHVELDAIIASPMKRAEQTAEHIAAAVGLPVETFYDLHEHLQAEDVRGKAHDDPAVLSHVSAGDYYEHFAKSEPVASGFEHFDAVLKRMRSCATFLKEHQAANIVVVSHATYLRTLAAFLLLQEKGDKEIIIRISRSLKNLSNAAITEFMLEPEDGWRLYTWNDNAHFAE